MSKSWLWRPNREGGDEYESSHFSLMQISLRIFGEMVCAIKLSQRLSLQSGSAWNTLTRLQCGVKSKFSLLTMNIIQCIFFCLEAETIMGRYIRPYISTAGHQNAEKISLATSKTIQMFYCCFKNYF